MKILQIITSLKTGGAEKLVTESALLFQRKGLNVDILHLKIGDTNFRQTLQLKSKGKVMGLTHGSVYNPFLVFKIRHYISGYDVVHVHLFPSLYWVAFARIKSRSKAKFVYTEHSTSNRRRRKAFWRLLDKYVYSQYDKIISISPEVERELKMHLNLSSDRYAQVENGINLSDIQHATPLHEEFFSFSKLNSKLIIQVSSFRWQKDQRTLIRALRRLPENIKLLLVGDGPLRTACENYAIEMNVSERVRFLGIRNDVPQLLKTVDIVVLSSNHEGLSLASVEGMASGSPFIASDVPGLTEIVKGAGVLFPKGDDKALAENISSLLADNNYYQKVAKACLIRAKQFDINRMVEAYISLYQEIIVR